MALSNLAQYAILDSAPSSTNNFDIGGGVNGNMVLFPSDTTAGDALAFFGTTAIDGIGAITGVSDSVNGAWTGIDTLSDGGVVDQFCASYQFKNAAQLKATAWTASACSMSGGSLIVGGSFAGTVRIGQLVTGSGVPANVRVTGPATGGAGTYTVNNSSTVGTVAMIGKDAVTVTYSQFGDFQGGWIVDVNGCSANGATAHHAAITTSASGPDSQSSGTAACGSTGGLMIGLGANTSGNAATWAPPTGTGFTNSVPMWVWDGPQATTRGEWQYFSNPGTKAATFSPTTADTFDVMMLFFQDSSSSTPTQYSLQQDEYF